MLGIRALFSSPLGAPVLRSVSLRNKELDKTIMVIARTQVVGLVIRARYEMKLVLCNVATDVRELPFFDIFSAQTNPSISKSCIKTVWNKILRPQDFI